MKFQSLFLHLFIAAIFFSCRNAVNRTNVDSRTDADTDSITLVDTFTRIDRPQDSVKITPKARRTSIQVASSYTDTVIKVDSVYQIHIYKNSNSDDFGYDIVVSGITKIHQPNIPAISGQKGFSDVLAAQKVANIMVLKLSKGIMPPVVLTSELDSLGIH